MWQTRTPHNLTPLAVLILALAAAGCSSTPPGLSGGLNGAFVRAAPTWDLNHDGDVTCEEWRQYAASVFRDADINHDGKLTPEEFQRLAKIDRLFETANFAYYDVNRQGYVTLQEFLDRPNPAFTELDKNNTCVLKAHQLRAAIIAEPKQDNPGPATRAPGPGGR
jgi:Ca2+-binding EF-hand superfamily protein